MDKSKALDKFIELMGRFAAIKSIAALRDGCIMTTPLTICGSLFILIANLPVEGYGAFMASIFGTDWTAPLNAVAGATFGVLALAILMSVTYKYVEAEGCDAMMASILALSTFLILMPPELTTPGGEQVGNIIPKAWVGANGVITAILTAFVVGKAFVYCEKNHIGIKMPEAVPTGVARAFEALTPGLLLFFGGAVVYGLCHFIGHTTAPEVMFSVVQTPLQGLSDTLVGGILIAGLQSLLFWAGVHGPNVVGGVVGPLLTANSLDNQALLDAGQTLLGNPHAKIITIQMTEVFIKLGGCGITVGFVIAAWLSAKSDQVKSLMRLSTVPCVFNINEPIIFGLPIVFNPYMLVPFVLVPVLSIVLCYFAIATGFMSPFSAVQIPWTTPPIISGFLMNGWQGAVVQVAIIALSTAIYYPFVRMHDRNCLEQEKAEGAGL